MHRIWIDGPIQAGEQLNLNREETRRVRKVLRLGVGERLTLFNATGIEAKAEILGFFSGRARLKVISVEVCSRESPLRIHIIQALPKMDKMNWVIQKATELGVCEVGILLASRCVSRWLRDRQEVRMSRWRRISIEASRQSGRTEVPAVSGPWGVEAFCEHLIEQETMKLVLTESGPARGLGEALRNDRPEDIWVVVGPEGGLEESEFRQLKDVGFQAVRMGPRIFRTETAGVVAAAILQYQYGDLG